MTSATKAKGATEPTLAAQQVAAFEERLRLIGQRLCEVEGHCDGAAKTVYKEFNLGRVPDYETFSGVIVVSLDGKEVNHYWNRNGFSEDGARRIALRKLGFLGAEEWEPAPVAEPGTETDELKAKYEQARALAEKSLNNIGKATANKYLRWAGVEPLPERKRYTFAQPATNVMTYQIDANSEEDARRQLAVCIERDRGRTPGANAYGTRFLVPTDGEATIASVSVIG